MKVYEKIKYDIEQKHKSSYYSTECYLFDYLVESELDPCLCYV